MYTILRNYLRFLARKIIKKHRPYIIGVTGSVGKTTMTHNIATLLQTAFGEESVEISKYNYNGEFGLPLSVIGAKTGKKNPFLWLLVVLKALIHFFRPYPKYLILEYGIDHPGEMDFLLSVAVPDIAIITPIEPNHIEQFGKFENYKKEKLKILAYAKKSIIHDSIAENAPIDTSIYGFGNEKAMQVKNMKITKEGTEASVHFGENIYNIIYPSIGFFHIENILPLIYISEVLGVQKEQIQKSMKSMKVRKGRGSMLKGIGKSTIIDGSYNGGYLSLRKGLESLQEFFDTEKITLVIGDMRELGDEEETLHKQLANDILRIFTNCKNLKIYLVGPMTRKYIFPIISQKFDVKSALSSREVGKYIKTHSDTLSEKDILYVKGSQNTIFLEEAIKYWIDTKDFKNLCRQDPDWITIKEKFFDGVDTSML